MPIAGLRLYPLSSDSAVLSRSTFAGGNRHTPARARPCPCARTSGNAYLNEKAEERKSDLNLHQLPHPKQPRKQSTVNSPYACEPIY